jgi:hypothetical protein
MGDGDPCGGQTANVILMCFRQSTTVLTPGATFGLKGREPAPAGRERSGSGSARVRPRTERLTPAPASSSMPVAHGGPR